MMKSESLRIRLGPEEKQAFQEAADLAGMALSVWIRERLRKAARNELEDAGQHIAFLRPKDRVIQDSDLTDER